MATTTPPTPIVNRPWIAAEFSKGIEAERELVDLARSRAQAPPDPTLGVLYHEIAEADEKHRIVVETIATRYGHTPSRNVGGGITETLGRLKDKVGELGANPIQRIGHDLALKANAIHWISAWIHAFRTIGDCESAGELTTVLNEERTHRDALQESLNRLVTQEATSEEHPAK